MTYAEVFAAIKEKFVGDIMPGKEYPLSISPILFPDSFISSVKYDKNSSNNLEFLFIDKDNISS